MIITDFEQKHLKEAQALALSNYYEEREYVKALPETEWIPDLTMFVENGLGVAAIGEDGSLIGFLCCFEPWENAFGSMAIGTFSPIHAHGAVKEKRAEVYKRMYQYAAEKWVKRGIAYHAIALFAHDRDALLAMFQYGFGLRCVDAIRDMKPIELVGLHEKSDTAFEELHKESVSEIRELRRLLSEHLGKSPCFMNSSEEDFQNWILRAEKRDSRIFVAKEQDRVVAFVEVQDEGENFVTYMPDMKNICGALCLSEYRGQQIVQELLNYMMEVLKKDGVKRLGVDFESFNPTAHAFWLKYFRAYTHSVVRRIDECAIGTETIISE